MRISHDLVLPRRLVGRLLLKHSNECVHRVSGAGLCSPLDLTRYEWLGCNELDLRTEAHPRRIDAAALEYHLNDCFEGLPKRNLGCACSRLDDEGPRIEHGERLRLDDVARGDKGGLGHYVGDCAEHLHEVREGAVVRRVADEGK